MANLPSAGLVLLLHMVIPWPVIAGETELVVKGRRLASSLCAKCHLNAGQGEKQGPMGIPGFAAVANRPNQSFEDVVRWLRSVPPMMPDHKLTTEEMDVLAAFIMSLRLRK
jgi:mono/diheme cytochrome c family protein